MTKHNSSLKETVKNLDHHIPKNCELIHFIILVDYVVVLVNFYITPNSTKLNTITNI